MTKQHKATPEQWAEIEASGLPGTGNWGHPASVTHDCLLELRDRIEALEAAQQPQQDKLDRLIALDRDDPAGSLVERVADAIAAADDEGLTNMTWSNHSRAAILAVAAALLDWWDSDEVARTGWEAAKWLEQEASR